MPDYSTRHVSVKVRPGIKGTQLKSILSFNKKEVPVPRFVEII